MLDTLRPREGIYDHQKGLGRLLREPDGLPVRAFLVAGIGEKRGREIAQDHHPYLATAELCWHVAPGLAAVVRIHVGDELPELLERMLDSGICLRVEKTGVELLISVGAGHREQDHVEEEDGR